jgi:hypothetical protein
MEEYERCYVPDVAQKALERWDSRSTHYEVLELIEYSGPGRDSSGDG